MATNAGRKYSQQNTLAGDARSRSARDYSARDFNSKTSSHRRVARVGQHHYGVAAEVVGQTPEVAGGGSERPFGDNVLFRAVVALRSGNWAVSASHVPSRDRGLSHRTPWFSLRDRDDGYGNDTKYTKITET